MRKFFLLFGFLALLLLLSALYLLWGRSPAETLPTYFSYTDEELQMIRGLHSDKAITFEDLQAWDDAIFNLIQENKTGTTKASQIYTYLLVAQRDAAFISYNDTGKFRGSIDAVSKGVICAFMPDDCLYITTDSDAYSDALAQIVLAKVEKRIADDQSQLHTYPLQSEDPYWLNKRDEAFNGQDVGSWMPWSIASVADFNLPPPPELGSDERAQQLQEVRDAVDGITDEQKRAVIYWADGPGTKTAAAQWLELATTHMKETGMTDLRRIFMIRSILEMAIADTIIASHDVKYTYWERRPGSLDASIVTVIPTPNHPSYPSNSAAIGMTAATVMAYFFPEKSSEWLSIAEEIGNTRVWSGIHFPLDVQEGYAQGKKIAEAVLQKEFGDSQPQ